MTDVEKLRRFAQFVLVDWPQGGPGEFEIEAEAIKLGLIEGHEAKEPCCKDCWCALYHGTFPTTCYRRTKLLTGET